MDDEKKRINPLEFFPTAVYHVRKLAAVVTSKPTFAAEDLEAAAQALKAAQDLEEVFYQYQVEEAKKAYLEKLNRECDEADPTDWGAND